MPPNNVQRPKDFGKNSQMSRRGTNRVNQLTDNSNDNDSQYCDWTDTALWEQNEESPNEHFGQIRDVTFETIPISVLYLTSFIAASFYLHKC